MEGLDNYGSPGSTEDEMQWSRAYEARSHEPAIGLLNRMRRGGDAVGRALDVAGVVVYAFGYAGPRELVTDAFQRLFTKDQEL